jgi:hypothetical protein
MPDFPIPFLDSKTINPYDTVEFSTSSKGHVILLLNGHSYWKQNTRNNRIYWCCRHRNSLGCKAKVIQDAKTNRLESHSGIEHNHEVIKGRFKSGELRQSSMKVE